MENVGFIGSGDDLKVIKDGEELKGGEREKAIKQFGLEMQRERVEDLRGSLLEETDFLIMPDYPISEENYERVEEYRQILRDLDDFESAKLPTPPEIVFEKSRRVQRIYQEDYVETFKPNY